MQAVGFARDEAMLEYDSRSFVGYRYLHEYFTFPDKFLFFDIVGLDRIAGLKIAREIEIAILLRQTEREDRLVKLAQVVGRQTFKLGCTPVVNLFKQMAEPIRLTHQKAEYRVTPDVRRQRGMEVYSVDSVRKVVRARGHDEVSRVPALLLYSPCAAEPEPEHLLVCHAPPVSLEG